MECSHLFSLNWWGHRACHLATIFWWESAVDSTIHTIILNVKKNWLFETSIIQQNTNLSYIVKHLGWEVSISHPNNFGIYLKKRIQYEFGDVGLQQQKSYFHFASRVAPYYHIIKYWYTYKTLGKKNYLYVWFKLLQLLIWINRDIMEKWLVQGLYPPVCSPFQATMSIKWKWNNCNIFSWYF